MGWSKGGREEEAAAKAGGRGGAFIPSEPPSILVTELCQSMKEVPREALEKAKIKVSPCL